MAAPEPCFFGQVFFVQDGIIFLFVPGTARLAAMRSLIRVDHLVLPLLRGRRQDLAAILVAARMRLGHLAGQGHAHRLLMPGGWRCASR